MLKVAVVVLAGTETHEGLARVVNARPSRAPALCRGQGSGRRGLRALLVDGFQILTF